MEEERRKVTEGRRKEEEERKEVERKEVKRVEEERKESVRMEWRRWARRTLVKPEAIPVAKGAGAGLIRVAIRLPGGDGRSIRQFSPDDTLTTLYAYVDSQFIPPSLPTSSDPVVPPQSDLTIGKDSEASIEAQIQSQSREPSSDGEVKADAWWGFKLVLAYPRRELVWAPRTTLGSVDGLKGGAQIVVEKIGIARGREGSISPRSAGAVSPTGLAEDEEEDGYDTESD